MQDLEKLQGTWSVTHLELNGTTLPPATYADAKIILTADKFKSLSMGAVYEGRIELDPTKTPKTLKMIFTEGPERGNTNFGISELNGDSWKFCLAITGGPAPVSFATTPNSGCALQILTREPSPRP
jgi:uncharacterized protein (TIGR03067 family)